MARESMTSSLFCTVGKINTASVLSQQFNNLHHFEEIQNQNLKKKEVKKQRRKSPGICQRVRGTHFMLVNLPFRPNNPYLDGSSHCINVP